MPIDLHTEANASLSDAELSEWKGIPISVAVDLEPGRQIDPAVSLRTRASAPVTLIGRAFTVACTPPDFGSVVFALDHAGPGDVVVIAAAGQMSCAVIGEILGGHLRSKGCAGLVVDGAVRDIAALGGWPDFPVYARGINPLGPTSATDGTLRAPVVVGGCQISQGDLVLGDADGLIALSPELSRARIDAAKAKLHLEQQWITGLAAGQSAKDVFGL